MLRSCQFFWIRHYEYHIDIGYHIRYHIILAGSLWKPAGIKVEEWQLYRLTTTGSWFCLMLPCLLFFPAAFHVLTADYHPSLVASVSGSCYCQWVWNYAETISNIIAKCEPKTKRSCFGNVTYCFGNHLFKTGTLTWKVWMHEMWLWCWFMLLL